MLTQLLALGAVQITISLTVNAIIAIIAGSIAAFLAGRPLWLLVQRWLMGTVLAGLALGWRPKRNADLGAAPGTDAARLTVLGREAFDHLGQRHMAAPCAGAGQAVSPSSIAWREAHGRLGLDAGGAARPGAARRLRRSATRGNRAQRATPISTPSASVGRSPTRKAGVADHRLELVVALDHPLAPEAAQASPAAAGSGYAISSATQSGLKAAVKPVFTKAIS